MSNILVLISSGIQKFVNGDLLGALVDPYISTMGFWFYGILAGTLAISIYLKSGQIALPITLGLIVFGYLLTSLPPEIQGLAYVLTAVAGAGVLYRVFKG